MNSSQGARRFARVDRRLDLGSARPLQCSRPAMLCFVSAAPATSTPRRASPTARPDHHAKSWGVAGPWLVKYRAASSPSASSRSSARDSGTHSSSSTNVGWRPRRVPKQRAPCIPRTIRTWSPRPPAVAIPARSRTAYASARVIAWPPVSALSRRALPLRKVGSFSASWRLRASHRAKTRGVSKRSIQRTSRDAIKCNVPRIGHVRRMTRSARARSTSPSVVLAVRRPMPQSAPRYSCA